MNDAPTKPTQVRPVDDLVLVRQDAPDAASDGTCGVSIALPGGAAPSRGVVVSVGPGRVLENGERAPLPLAPGDAVAFKDRAGTEIVVDGVPHLLMSGTRDVLGVIG